MKGYGEKLIRCRKKKRKTMEQVAEELCISKASVSLYEREKRNPSDAMKRNFAQYYQRTVQELFFSDEKL